MPIWLSGASTTATAVDIKYPPVGGPEPVRDLAYWLNYYKDVYPSAADARRAAEAARDKAAEDRRAIEAARLRRDWATTPGRLSTQSVTPEEVKAFVERLREEAAWIDGRVEVGPEDPAGQIVEVAFSAEVRPELIKGTLALALGPLAGDIDRIWSGLERHWAHVRQKGGDITERRAQLFIPAAGHDLDQRYRMFVPAGQAREIAEARAALDRAVDQAKSGQDKERLEQLRAMVLGARALGDVEEAQVAAREAAARAETDRAREAAAEERARAAEEAAVAARAEAERIEEQRRVEVADLERRLAEAERQRAEAERRAEREARERLLMEETLRKFEVAFGLPVAGMPRELVPVAERKKVKKVKSSKARQRRGK